MVATKATKKRLISWMRSALVYVFSPIVLGWRLSELKLDDVINVRRYLVE